MRRFLLWNLLLFSVLSGTDKKELLPALPPEVMGWIESGEYARAEEYLAMQPKFSHFLNLLNAYTGKTVSNAESERSYSMRCSRYYGLRECVRRVRSLPDMSSLANKTESAPSLLPSIALAEYLAASGEIELAILSLSHNLFLFPDATNRSEAYYALARFYEKPGKWNSLVHSRRAVQKALEEKAKPADTP